MFRTRIRFTREGWFRLLVIDSGMSTIFGDNLFHQIWIGPYSTADAALKLQETYAISDLQPR